MGKDSLAHWRGYFARGPLYLKLSSKAEMSWFAFSHWSMQSSWGVFLVTKYRLLWFALRPSLGLQQLWKHLYAAHLNTCFRQIFRGFQKGKTNAFPLQHTLSFLWMLKAEINPFQIALFLVCLSMQGLDIHVQRLEFIALSSTHSFIRLVIQSVSKYLPESAVCKSTALTAFNLQKQLW